VICLFCVLGSCSSVMVKQIKDEAKELVVNK
jgi:cellobiose-specific phosphotransferase system component IIB